MEKVINSYECLFIVDTAIGEDAVKAKVEKFTGKIAANAEFVEVNEWGKRRLAYPINDKPEGHYVIVTFKSAPEFLAELDRVYNIDETIMRSLTTKLEYDAAEKKAAKLAAAEAAPVAEAAEVATEADEATAE